MSPYDRFQTSLLTAFKLEAQPHLRSLWADLEDLEEAADPHACSAALQLALHRVLVLERAAGSARAQSVENASHAMARRLSTMSYTRAGVRPGSHDALDQMMINMTDAMDSIRPELVESCAD